MRDMPQSLRTIVAAGVALAALACAAPASARIIEVGAAPPEATPTCPSDPCLAVSRDDLMECAALLRSIRRGELDAIVSHDAPLDVLAQQVVAESSSREYSEDELFALVRRAWPYRDLPRADFDAVVRMTAEGFSTRRGHARHSRSGCRPRSTRRCRHRASGSSACEPITTKNEETTDTMTIYHEERRSTKTRT